MTDGCHCEEARLHALADQMRKGLGVPDCVSDDYILAITEGTSYRALAELRFAWNKFVGEVLRVIL